MTSFNSSAKNLQSNADKILWNVANSSSKNTCNTGNTRLRLLEQLARYKFLSVSQCIDLWYPRSKQTLYRNLRDLKELSYIGAMSYKYSPSKGKLEDMHYLQNRWKKYLQDKLGIEESKLLIPKSHKGFYEDYMHRKRTIQCQIIIDLKCDSLSFLRFDFYHYFESQKLPNKKYRQKATKLIMGDSYIIPDSILLHTAWNKQLLFCLEVHNGHRVARIEKQLKQYAQVLASGAASIKYNVEVNPYILVVFEHQSTLQTTLERMNHDEYYTHLKTYYLMKTYDDFVKNPCDHWVNLNWEKVHLLNL